MGRRSWGRLRKLPSGRWQAQYVGPDQRLYRAPSTFVSRAMAEGWLAERRREIDLNTWGSKEPPAGSLALAEYAATTITRRNLKPRTRMLYESMLSQHILPTLGALPLARVSPEVVRAWYADLGTDHPTRNRHLYGLLHSVMADAVRDGHVARNPCVIRNAMAPGKKRNLEILTPAELHALADAMPPELRLSVLIAGWCGTRWGETAELRRKDFRDGKVHVTRAVTYRDKTFTVGTTKTAESRVVALPPHIVPDVEEHLKALRPNDLLFPHPTAGGHYRDDQYRVPFKRAAAEIGREGLRVHDLRHTAATLATVAGGGLTDVMNRLGHSTTVAALRYQHLVAERDQELAERLSSLWSS